MAAPPAVDDGLLGAVAHPAGAEDVRRAERVPGAIFLDRVARPRRRQDIAAGRGHERQPGPGARVEAGQADYVVGLCPADALEVFKATKPGEAGIDVAYFNTRDGRVRQNNLHYARPARIGRLDRIEEMYEHRHQRRFWNMFKLALRLLLDRVGGLKIAVLFGVMHLAGIADRSGRRRIARWLGRRVTLELNRKTIARLLDTKFAFVVTESGGCALDVDTEGEYDAMQARFGEWSAAQRARSKRLFGALPERFDAEGSAARARDSRSEGSAP